MPTLAEKIKHRWTSHQHKRTLKKYFPKQAIAPFVAANRKTCQQVTEWISAETLEQSIFRYGISPGMESLLMNPIDNHITYTDIMALLAAKLKTPVSYLEIGVSVGKNFLQMAHALQHGRLVGFDIEEMNPVLEHFFCEKEMESWQGSSDLKKTSASMRRFTCHTNEIWYLCSDEFDEAGWKRLQGQSFNLVFSDALHNPDALRYEFEQLMKFNLLHPAELVMVWDDLGGEMENVFHENYDRLKSLYPVLHKYQFVTNGWMNLKVHPIGIITTQAL